MIRTVLCCLAASTVIVLSSCSHTERVETEEYGMKVVYYVDTETGAREGLYQKFELNGTLYEEANYVSDTLQGRRTIFFKNGNPEIEENYASGVLNGAYTTYYEEGGKDIEGEYRNGVMEGIWKRHYPSGQIMELVTFADNAENGPFTEYHENGNLKAEGQYAGGNREQGLLKLYDENGELYKKMECDDGICHTTWTRPGYQPDADE